MLHCKHPPSLFLSQILILMKFKTPNRKKYSPHIYVTTWGAVPPMMATNHHILTEGDAGFPEEKCKLINSQFFFNCLVSWAAAGGVIKLYME